MFYLFFLEIIATNQYIKDNATHDLICLTSLRFQVTIRTMGKYDIKKGRTALYSDFLFL
jgi:hypothetical protein